MQSDFSTEHDYGDVGQLPHSTEAPHQQIKQGGLPVVIILIPSFFLRQTLQKQNLHVVRKLSSHLVRPFNLLWCH